MMMNGYTGRSRGVGGLIGLRAKTFDHTLYASPQARA
jgi:hypothetical protein